MEYFLAALNKITDIDHKTWSQIQGISTVIKFPKKHLLCAQGSAPEYFYFIKKGVTRAYITSNTGSEYNKALFVDDMFFGPLSAMIKGDNSKVAYETLTNCELVEINIKEFMNLVEQSDSINRLYRKVLEVVFLKLETRDIEMVTLNATERYEKLQKRIPGIDNLISQYHIASNLGITSIQLSRIRKKLAAK